jgi:hypothetical protein
MCSLTAFQAKADLTPVVEYTSTGALYDTRPFTLGYEFQLSRTFDITALGYWAPGLVVANGYQATQQVGVWDSSGNLLASATVSDTDPIIGHFQYQTISTLVLGPGTYMIGGTYDGGVFQSFATGVTSQPGYTWVTDEWTYGPGLNDPTTSSGGTYGANGIFQVDLATSSTATPEPGYYGVLALGVGTLAAMANRRKKAQKA